MWELTLSWESWVKPKYRDSEGITLHPSSKLITQLPRAYSFVFSPYWYPEPFFVRHRKIPNLEEEIMNCSLTRSASLLSFITPCHFKCLQVQPNAGISSAYLCQEIR